MSLSIVKNQDCMEGMKGFSDKYFDLAIVDCPYGIGEDGDRSNRLSANAKWQKRKPKVYQPKDWDKSPPSKEYFEQLFRVSKNQIIWGANHFISLMPYNSASWIVWDKKTNGVFSDCELAWCSIGGRIRKFEWLWDGFRKQVFEERFHPTQKPIALYDWLLSNYAKAGDKILDTHLGSGSSRIAAHELGFDFYGFELDADYYEAQEKRFREYLKQPKLFEPVKIEHKQEVLF